MRNGIRIGTGLFRSRSRSGTAVPRQERPFQGQERPFREKNPFRSRSDPQNQNWNAVLRSTKKNGPERPFRNGNPFLAHA